MRCVYGGGLGAGSTAEHRLRAFRRTVSDDVLEFPYERPLATRIPFARRLGDRYMLSPGVAAINRALLQAVERYRPDVVWLDKPIFFRAETILALARKGIRTISYMPDDPFGPRGDFGWRLFRTALPHYWGHVVPREVTRRDFLARGAVRVACVPFAFEPSIHFPAETLGLCPPKTYDVTFIGSPYDDRADWIANLVRALPKIRFGLFGPGWRRHAARLAALGVACNPPLWNDQYREVIWRSKLSLSFVTRANRDEASHKAVEIAASGTAVVLDRSPVHDRVFRDRESAHFFDDPADLADVVQAALSRKEHWTDVGSRGAAAVRDAGLSNDAVLRSALAQLVE